MMVLNRRWYDQEPACSRLIEQIRRIPQAEIREFCARVALHFIEKFRKEMQRKGKTSLAVNSIGIPAIAGLYQFGHQRNRWYDTDPLIHKTVGLLYTLPLEGLAVIGFKLGDSFGMIEIYAQVCQQLGQPADLKDLTRICTTTLQAGKGEARNLLIDMVGPELYESLTLDPSSPPASDP